MKKFITLLLLTTLSVAAFAETAVIAYTGTTTTNMTGNNDAAKLGLDANVWSVVGAKGGGNNFPGLNKDGTIRLYYNVNGGSTITVASLNGATINSVNIEFKANNANAWVKVNNNTVTPNNGTYTINNQSFVVGNNNTSNVQVHIVKMTINYTAGSNVIAPTISGTTPFPNSTVVTIESATTDAQIYYTTNGQEPTNNSTLYNNPFTVTQTTTVKAVAYLNNQHSTVTAKTFTAMQHVQNIAQINALDDNTPFVMDNNTLCILNHGQYTYIQDATAATLIYGTLPQDVQLNITDVIPPGWNATKTTYANFPEITGANGFSQPTEQQHIDATTITLDNISTNDWAKYVVAKKVKITAATVQPPTPTENTATFDFDNNYTTLFGVEPISSGSIDFESDQTISNNGVTMIVSTSTTTTPNRIWYASPRLRMYGGTMTITAPTGYNLTQLDISQGKWSSDNTANSGNLTSNKWTGNTNNLVITIGANTQFKSITATFENNPTNAPLKAQATGNYTLTDENNNTLTAYTNKLGYTEIPDDLTKTYDAYGVLDFHNGTPQLLPLGFVDAEGTVTGAVQNLNTNRIPVNITYYNTTGLKANKPFDGINIVVIQFNDGTTTTNKIVKY